MRSEIIAALRRLHDLANEVDLVALDAVAVRTSVDLVAQAQDFDVATPCAGWALGDLVAHMTVQHHGFATATAGNPFDWEPAPLGEDPIGAYREAAQHVLLTFAAPDVLDRKVLLPELSPDRPFSAAQAMSFHFIDYVVHSWDVAKALNVPVTFSEDLLDAAMVVALATPGGPARLAPGAAFGPEVPATGATGLDEIVALLGRSPTWPR